MLLFRGLIAIYFNVSMFIKFCTNLNITVFKLRRSKSSHNAGKTKKKLVIDKVLTKK